jgi:predicted small secreted protein
MKWLGVLLAVLFAVPCTMLSGCSTIEGVGRDIGRAGDAIEDEARDTRQGNN